MSEARETLLAVNLPAPAQQLLLANDDHGLIAELGGSYDRYHQHLAALLVGTPGIGQSLAGPGAPLLSQPAAAVSNALIAAQQQQRIRQDVQDAEQLLRGALALAQAGTPAGTLEDLYGASARLPATDDTGKLLASQAAAGEQQRLQESAAGTSPTGTVMDAVRGLQAE